MAKYSYKLDNEVYCLYENDKPISTPHGNPIIAETESLAHKLVEALEQGKDYMSGDSILTYHYTYCNLIADYSLEDLAEGLGQYADYDHLLYDDYLMFRQDAPVKQAIADFLGREIPEAFKQMNFYQLSAMVVINSMRHSWVLPYMLVIDVIEQIDEQMDEEDITELKEEFIDDIAEFEANEFGDDTDSDEYQAHLDAFSKTIDMFIEYFTMHLSCVH